MPEQDKLYNAIGEKIRAARDQANMTQSQLAAKLHISRASVVNIEKGRQRLPIHLLFSIGEVLAVEPRQLIPKSRPYRPLPDRETETRILQYSDGNLAVANQLRDFVQMAKSEMEDGKTDGKG